MEWGTTWKKGWETSMHPLRNVKEGSTHSQGEQLGSGGAWAQTEVGHGLCTPNTRSKVRKFTARQDHIRLPPSRGAGGRGPVAPAVSGRRRGVAADLFTRARRESVRFLDRRAPAPRLSPLPHRPEQQDLVASSLGPESAPTW
uniref:Uncharacterized protein n=1 Tax=Myotis myotis TaxID=51298 RepID=A0A7J7Z5E8_MYOMY|nr:hypothetical protein mMyoMyo1_010687 [Myotis myotis]